MLVAEVSYAVGRCPAVDTSMGIRMAKYACRSMVMLHWKAFVHVYFLLSFLAAPPSKSCLCRGLDTEYVRGRL